VVFGDGVNGAPPPTGKDNVRAAYRKGIGASGNVATGAIQVLLDNVAGLQKVTNPVLASGGSDAETPGQIRLTAPKSVRTFSRAVSVDDYAALALTYPGVAKASASRVTNDTVTGAALARPYIRLTVAASGGTPLAEQRSFAAALRAYLDRRRDPNAALRIVDFTPVSIDLSATLDFLDDYPREATLASATAAALDFFSFDRLGFGQSQRLSAVYAMLQSVAGVRSATITRFRATGDSSGAAATDVVVRSTGLAVLNELDLQPGTGGFADR
jgi:predicted phage baseplate assembly protein